MATAGGTTDRAPAETAAKTFVLVHGAWYGGWCWRRVSDRLEQRGHQVFAPTMTGLGERSHRIDAKTDLKTDLATHITDIVNVIKWENLSDIVLVDAFVPENGESLAGIASPRVREGIQAVLQKGERSVALPKAAFFQVNEKDQAWVDEKCTPQPVATLSAKIALGGARERIAKKAYIRAKGYGNPGFDAYHAKLQANPAWRAFEMLCGHDAMVDMPDRLVEILLEVA
jgi:hypothetical protein